MKLIGLMPARNEGWVIGFSLRALLQWADAVVVLLHACEDDTAAIVDQIRVETGDRVIPIIEPNPDWNEIDFHQRMLECGRRLGGTHFAVIDADEVVTANLLPHIRGWIESLKPGQLLKLPWPSLWNSLDQWRSDRCHDLPLAFGDHPDLGFHPRRGGYQIHQRQPQPLEWARSWIEGSVGGLMHLQHVSAERARARQAKHQMHEFLRWPGFRGGAAQIAERHNRALDETGLTLAPVPASWWAYDLDRSLIAPDREPWESRECRRMLASHGAAAFQGLTLYGQE
jgi:hypothetical protein